MTEIDGKLTITPLDIITNISAYPKRRVDVRVARQDGEKPLGRFIEKNYVNERQAQEVEEKYLALRRIFEQAIEKGKISYLPLPQSFIRAGRITLTSDVTSNGNLIYDKHTRDMEIGVPLANAEASKLQCTELMDIAFEGGIETNEDTYSLVVDPISGVGSAMLLDLDHGCRFISEGDNSSSLRMETAKIKVGRIIDRFTYKK